MLIKQVLFILHIPPPVHGSSVVGKQIMDSKLINGIFKTDYINLGTSKSVDDIGGLGVFKILTYMKILFTVFKKVLSKKYDVVYIAPTVSNFGFYKDFIVVVIVKLFQKKIIFHQHNKGVSQRKKNGFNNFLYHYFYKDVYVILLSKLLYKDISEFVPENRVHICPNGVQLVSKLESIILNKTKNKIPTILFLSNLIESKGVYVLLESCKILKEQKIKFKCWFVGGEGDILKTEFLSKIDEFSLSDNVTYLGKKYGNEKHDVFLNSDIFIFPTFYHNECFPLVTLEAMQYSIPVISSDEGGIPDIIKNDFNGIIVPSKNSEELAKKIMILIKDEKLRKELGNNGREKFLNEYTLDKFEQNLVNIISDIV
jgi:glycosyltransferase involved in cell wall biosynthesis